MATAVKAELIEDGPDKENQEVEELPDFGGEEEQNDSKNEGPAAADVVKKEEVDEKSKGEPRLNALHLTGVNRLTRTHLAEIFASKQTPAFERVEWIADDKCLCIFKDQKAAKSALDAAIDGFEQGRDKPGPGLWRAIRGMMDFRQATVLDVPSANFKKQHRAGRQVRDYRFWEAAKDIDKNIMENLDQGVKRDLPSGEDAIAAAMYAEEIEGPRKKRRTMPKEAKGEEEAEAPDLLQQMAQQDKELMGLKAEEVPEEQKPMAESGEADAVAAVSDAMPQERWEDSWFAQQAKSAGRRREDAWGRHAQADPEPRGDFDARDGQGERRDVRDRGEWRHNHYDRRTRDWGHDDRRDEARKRRGDGSFQERTDRPTRGPGSTGVVWQADAEEKAKRVRRMDRFSKAAPAAATDTAGDEANL